MQMEHRGRLGSVQKQIHNESPKKFKHMVYNPKRIQQMSERYQEIEKNNQMLLKKMSKIIKGKETFGKFQYLTVSEQRNIGFASVTPRAKFVRNNNASVMSNHSSASKKSLNYDRRVRDHKRII